MRYTAFVALVFGFSLCAYGLEVQEVPDAERILTVDHHYLLHTSTVPSIRGDRIPTMSAGPARGSAPRRIVFSPENA